LAVPKIVNMSSAIAATTGNLNRTWLTGHQTNDIALDVYESANEAVVLGTNPDSFAETADSPQGTGVAPGTPNTATRLTAFWCRATSSAMQAYQATDAGDHILACQLLIRGCATTGNPFDVTAGDTAASATAVSIPGDTTTEADCLIVAIVVNATDSTTPQVSGWANASLTNFLERFNDQSGSGNGGGIAIASGSKATAGAYDATTATLATASVQGRLSIAFRSANPGVPDSEIGFVNGMSAHGNRSFSPRVRGDLWVQPGDARASDPLIDTWEGEAT
jgi:hypothetical protein